MDGIRSHIINRAKRTVFSRVFHSKDRGGGEAIATWKLELDKIRRVLDVRSSAARVGAG